MYYSVTVYLNVNIASQNITTREQNCSSHLFSSLTVHDHVQFYSMILLTYIYHRQFPPVCFFIWTYSFNIKINVGGNLKHVAVENIVNLILISISIIVDFTDELVSC